MGDLPADYYKFLLSRNLSNEVLYSFYKGGKISIRIPLSCVLLAEPVNVPIRHSSSKTISCIFDIENWVEWSKENKDKKWVKCPGCSNSVDFKNYGVDRHLYNALEMAKRFNMRDEPYQSDVIVYYPNQQVFKVIDDKKQEHQIPGIVNISQSQMISKDPESRLKQQLSDYTQMYKTTVANTLYNQHEIVKKLLLDGSQLVTKKFDLEGSMSKFKLDVPNMDKVKREMNLFSYVFFYDGKDKSAKLVVCYPLLKIWYAFDLYKEDKQIFLYRSFFSTIKCSQSGKHYVYIFGGVIQGSGCEKSVYRFEFPQDPFSIQERKLIGKHVADLPEPMKNPMVILADDTIYLLGGITREHYDDYPYYKCFKMTRNQYKWEQIPSPQRNRVHGSIIYSKPRKVLCFFGGVSKFLTTLNTEDEKVKKQSYISFYLIEKKQWIEMDGIYNLCSPDFTRERVLYTPYIGEKYLIISGVGLTDENRGMYTFDISCGVFQKHSQLSFQSPEILSIFKRDCMFMNLIQDYEGVMINNEFHSLSQIQVKDKLEVLLYSYNVQTGKILSLELSTKYVKTEDSLKKANLILQSIK